MAYAFEKIMNQMDGGKIDVFNQQGQGQGQGQQAGGDAMGQQGVSKTEAGGDVSGSGGGGGGGQKSSLTPQSDAQASRTVGAQKAFEASKSAAPVSLSAPMGKVSQQLNKASEDLQAEANQYKTQELGKQNYNVGEEDLGKAVGGDKDAGAKVAGVMGRTQVDPVSRFAPKTDYTVEDIEKFKSSPGIQSYLRGQFGPSYTAGGAALDTQRLRSDPAFTQNVQALQNTQNQLTEQANKYLGDTGLESEVRNLGQENLKTSQAAIRKFLEEQQEALETANAGELTSWLENVAALKDPNSAQAQALIQGAQPTVQQRIQEVVSANPALAKYLTPESMAAFGFSPGEYLRPAETTGITSADFYDQDEAAKFNRIMGFLGTGGASRQAGRQPTAPGTFDLEGYINRTVGTASGKNELADITAKQTIDQILGRARGAQGAAQSGLNSLGQNPWETLARRSADQVLGGNSLGIDPMSVDPRRFYTPGAVSGNVLDYIDPNDVGAANTAFEELMDPTRFSAGSQFGQNPYSWDEQGYKDALHQILAQRAGMPGAQPGSLPPANLPRATPGTVQIDTQPQPGSVANWIPFFDPIYGPGTQPGFDDPLGGLFGGTTGRL